MSRRRQSAGFTLVEVMVGLAILAMSLTVLSQIQQGAMRRTLSSKMMTIATLLAREKMTDAEDKLFEKGLSDFDEKDEGDFEEAGHKRFKYVLQIEKIELPSELSGKNAAAAGQKAASESGRSGGGALAAKGAVAGQQFDMFRKVIEESIRRVTLTVKWKEGTTEKKVTVESFFTDSRKINRIGNLLGALKQLGGGGAGGAGTPGSGGTAGKKK